MKQDVFNYMKNSLIGRLSEPLCDEYKALWRKCGEDKKSLATLALSQQALPHFMTYSLNGLGVGKDCIKNEFSDYINGASVIMDADGVKGYTTSLYVDYTEDVVASENVLAFMYCKDVHIDIPSSHCPFIYVGCKSKININCCGFNSVFVYLFDESEVNIEYADDNCVVTIFKYSDKCKVSRSEYCFSEKVKEHRKELKI